MNQGGLMIETQERDVKKVDPTWKRILGWPGWDLMFVLFGVIGVLGGDTLFFFLPLINENNRCIELDNRLKIVAYCLRSVFDVIYIANMIFNFIKKKIQKKRFGYLDFVIDIFALLPIPQVLVPIILKKMRSSKFLDARIKILKFFVLLQYVPRIVRVVRNYLSWTETFAACIWIKASFDFFVYTQACHVLGAFWYFFSIERQTTCWYKACKVDPKCILSSFKCGRKLQNNTFLDDFCRVQTSNTTLFDFGIFREALESGIVSSTDIPQKFVYCSWWGLRNLSSFGSNLETSNYIWENFFSIIISVFGLLLFLYFIGSVQSYMQMAIERATKRATKEEKIRAKEEEIRAKIESWVTINDLPCNMKERIINCIQDKLEEIKDFDIEKLISHLSKDLITKIKQRLYLPLLKNVPQLQGPNGLQLQLMICDYLKPVHYNQHHYIVREGEPLDAMIFITQGIVWNFTTIKGKGSANWIEKDGFYGEELLNWGLELSDVTNISNLPMSTKSLKTHTEVEAFALMASDLRTILSSFQAY